MAIWNNPYQMYPQQQIYPYQQMQQPQQPVQARAIEAIPVDNEEQVRTWPVNVGATVLFMAKDDSFVAFKTNDVKGELPPVFYDMRPPAPPAPVFDPAAYSDLEKRVAALEAISAPRRAKKEAAEE